MLGLVGSSTSCASKTVGVASRLFGRGLKVGARMVGSKGKPNVTVTVASLRHHLLHHGFDELRGPVLGSAELGFKVVAELHQMFDLGDDALLLGEGW